jgi:hypothetical protein
LIAQNFERMKKLLLFAIIIIGVVQFGCKKNSTGGTPVVKDVRTVNPATADSFFTQALPGSLIVIQGSGFSGLQAVYFNDTAANFNPVYATDNNIIVTIPATAQTAATNSKVPSQIKIVTSHGTGYYTFSLVLPPPAISSISLDNTGTVLTINGTNLIGISKITFPIGNSDTAAGYTVNTTNTQIMAGVPAGTATRDSVRVYCTFGVASFPYPPPIVIASVSDENAIAGTTITISGSNFIGISQVIFPGGIVGTNLQVQGFSQMTVVVPAGITAPDSLRVQGIVGTVAAPQLFDSYLTHPSPGYLSTFEVQYATDNTGFVGWTGGYANASQAATSYPNGTGAVGVLVNGGPIPGNTGAGGNLGNPGFVQLNDVPWVSNTGAAAANYSLKFEIFVAAPWTAGELWVMGGDWYGWQHCVARYAPWTSAPGGKFQPTGWTTVTIPLNQFINATVGGTSVLISGKTQSPITDANVWDYQSWPVGGTAPSSISNFGSTALCFTLVNDQASPAVPKNGLNLAIDNVRIVQGK